MCLKIDRCKHQGMLDKIRPEYCVAKENIPVYKVVFRQADGRHVAPFHRRFVYTPNTTYKTRFQITHHEHLIACYTVERGFHGFKALANAHAFYEQRGKWRERAEGGKYIIVKMIIPKGTHYYYGEANDIVSNKIRTLTFRSIHYTPPEPGYYLDEEGYWCLNGVRTRLPDRKE